MAINYFSALFALPNTLLSLCIACLFMACQNDTPPSAASADNFALRQSSLAQQSSVYCMDVSLNPERAPSFDVYWKVKGETIKITQVIACDSLDEAQYDGLQIPKDALHVKGGWGNKIAHYFYVKETGEKLVFMKTTLHEEDTSMQAFKEIAEWNNGQFFLTGVVSPAEISGLYKWKSANEAWVAIIGLHKDHQLAIQLFRSDAPIKDKATVQTALSTYEPHDLGKLEYQQNTAHFQSENASGFLQRSAKGIELVFTSQHLHPVADKWIFEKM